MADLSSLYLEPVYDSAEHNLVNDLIVPLLSRSVEYCRGVGYFSSGWLRLAATGLNDLISAGGRARLIMSPILVEADWQAIVAGQEAKGNEALRQNLHVSVKEIATSLEKDTLNTFAWLIADELLDIRFAVPRIGYQGGDYHDKVAYFRDLQGNAVAIHGSCNDSIKGSLNGEAFSVFRSWEAGQTPYLNQHISRLDRLWGGDNPQFHSFTLPNAIKQQIVQLRESSNRPYKMPSFDSQRNKRPSIPPEFPLRDYQIEAIQKWQECNRQGVLEMATGSGKTYTALGAAVEELSAREKMLLVILVPYVHLLDQWKEDCEAFGFHPILCGSSNTNWRASLRSAVTDFRVAKSPLCVISVHQTATSDTFLTAFDKIKADQKMLIADEVHGLGAKQLRRALQDNFEMRLGLSATPRRWYDKEGTKTLFDYFKNTCFEFSLKDAIDRKFLVTYRYEPQLVTLSEDEEESLEKLSKLIGQLAGKKARQGLDDLENARLEKALRSRALIVKKAENKLHELRRLLCKLKEQNEEFKHSLFYSPEGQYQEVLRLLKEEGIFAHQFIGENSSQERKQVLNDFDNGRILSLVAMKCLDEGVDIPATRSAFFIASTTNPKEFIQRRGRVLRRSSGKNKAYIYDFIVVPSPSTSSLVANYLFEREMPRFAEFSDLAENQFEARSILHPILDKYQMLHLLDLKPWDIYHRQNPQSRDDNEE